MSLFSSLYTSSAGMLSQTRSTQLISENIANMTTTGYKRSNAAFQDYVTGNKSTISDSGSVGSTRVNRISQQGGVQQTSSNLDLAVVGNGFFVVHADPTDPLGEDLYTRNGTFGLDAEGLMKNTAGYTLYGWAYDANGVVDSSALVPVDLDLLATQSRPTTYGEMTLNLDEGESAYDSHLFTPASELPVTSQAAHFTRSMTVYDSNGAERKIYFEFRRIVGPMAHFAGRAPIDRTDALVDPLGPTPGIANNDIFSISDGTNTLDITLVSGTPNAALNEAQTLQDVIDLINNYQGAGTSDLFSASLSEDGYLQVRANDPTVSLDLSGSAASVLGSTGLNIVADPGDADYVFEPEADLLTDGTANPNQTSFPSFANTNDPNPFGWWEMSVLTIDPANPSGTTQVEVRKGLINFNGDGTLNAVADASGAYSLDLSGLDFDSGDATENIDMTFDMTRFTQYSGAYTVGFSDQNGAPIGTLVDTEITREGDVLAVFSNGLKVEAFRIPLATFVNPDGLERIDGTAFRASSTSGDVTVSDALTGGAGAIQANALENSNVDLSEEFSGLIVSQRAYSLNGQVINAVDEMTQTLSRLKG